MLRQIWLHVALIIFSSNLFAQNNTYSPPKPKTGRLVKNLVSQISYREPFSTKKKLIMMVSTKLCMKQYPIGTIVSKYIQNPYVQER